jgi:hypothetical protein
MKVRGDLDVKGTILQNGEPVDGTGTSGFYDLTVALTDESQSFTGIKKLNFAVAGFYLKQNDPNTDEVGVFLRGGAGDTGPEGPTGPTGPEGPPGAGFYLTVKQTDDLASFGGINIINVNALDFYLTQNDPNTDEVTLNFRGGAVGPPGPAGADGDPGPGANCSIWRFSTTTTDADPGNGRFRLNNATQSAATQIYIDNQNNAGSDFSTFLLALFKKNNTLYIQQENDATRFHSYSIDADAVDAGGYVRVPAITNIDSGADLANNQTAFICVAVSGAQGAGFYLTVAHDDNTQSFGGISVIKVNTNSFYLTQNGDNTDEVILNFRGSAGGGGEANTASNLPGDEGIFFQKSGVDLEFKSLTAGANITLTPTDDTITIAAAAGSNPTFKETEAGGFSQSANTLAFHEAFYLSSGGAGNPVIVALKDSPPGLIETHQDLCAGSVR